MALMKVRDKDGNIKPILAIKGEQGDSAYQIAQADGFDGTEEEWLDSLIGRKGSKPVKGEDYLTEADKEEITNYTTNSVIEAATNMVIHNSEQDREYIDDEMAKLKEYIDIYHPVADLTINVTMSDGSAVPEGVYVTVYDLSNDSVYANIQFTGTPIVLKDIPIDFNYSVSASEIDGYFTNSINDILTEDTKLIFNYIKTAIYGVTWDKTSTTKLSRTGDAALFEDPVPYVAGASSYGSPFDNLYPWSEMSIVEDANAGTLVSIPKYWFKWTDDTSTLKLEIANYAAEGFAVSPAHRDRGDGKGERDVVYIGRYHCSDNYKSETGVWPKVSMTRANFRTNIHNIGSNVYQNDFAMFWTIRMLYLVEYADWDSQSAIGYGCGNGYSYGTTNMGYTDSMPYHTGTMISSRTTYGFGTQYRYIEGLWDNVHDWCDGIYISDNNIYGIMNPNNFSDTTGGALVCTQPTSNSYIKSWGISTVDGFDWFLYPTTVGGSSSTYISDNYSYGYSGVVLCVGGYYHQNLDYGMFYLNGFYNASYSNAGIGSRLMVLP